MVKNLTVKVLLGSVDSLKELADKDVNIKTGVALAKNIKELNDVLVIYNEKRSKLFDEYGETKDDVITIIEENVETFNEKNNMLLTEEVDVTINTIKVDELEDVNLKTSTLMSLDWLIEI